MTLTFSSLKVSPLKKERTRHSISAEVSHALIIFFLLASIILALCEFSVVSEMPAKTFSVISELDRVIYTRAPGAERFSSSKLRATKPVSNKLFSCEELYCK